jgi:hypothetical protein
MTVCFWPSPFLLYSRLDGRHLIWAVLSMICQSGTSKAICTHQHTPQYDSGFTAGCHDKRAGLLQRDPETNPIVPNINNDTNWMQGYMDAAADTSFCPS